uniref:DUF2442 domain-containing protein n=1 Tax=Shinella sp. SUS2 TaxID=1692241 RepID=UPI003526E868
MASTARSFLPSCALSSTTDSLSRRRGVNISATEIHLNDDTMLVSLDDGRTLGTPLAWLPRLLAANKAARLRLRTQRGRHSLG